MQSGASAAEAAETGGAAVERLLATNACPGCDLDEMDLSGANLMGADLEGAT
ncbi:MAG: pentapeptide repeat-containing protein, partial [Gammaproteobacteria bacterium]|nr:pentapeptide repeat-containing protein [Gammaproteobacteria bacterium]